MVCVGLRRALLEGFADEFIELLADTLATSTESAMRCSIYLFLQSYSPHCGPPWEPELTAHGSNLLPLPPDVKSSLLGRDDGQRDIVV